MDVSRRDLIKLGSTAAAASGLLGAPTAQAQAPAGGGQLTAPAPLGFDPADPALKFDLVVANGDVLDPSQRLRGKRDVGIKSGQIALVAPSIAADRSSQRIDAGGRLLTPGLVDLHAHFCPHVGIGLPADELVGITGTTTAVSAGDTGAMTLGAFSTGRGRKRARASSPSCTSPPSGWREPARLARWSISSTPTSTCAPRPWRRTPTPPSASRCG